jgi:hypothetical protein
MQAQLMMQTVMPIPLAKIIYIQLAGCCRFNQSATWQAEDEK